MHTANGDTHDLDANAQAELGSRVAQLRAEKRLTLTQLAARAEVSIGFLSELERGLANPSFLTMTKLARAFGVPFATFVAPDEEKDDPHGLVRFEDRRRLDLGPEDIDYELLTPTLHGKLAAYVTRIPPNWSNERVPPQHEGEEIWVVLEGESVVTIGEDVFHLRAGDSLTFDATRPHTVLNPGSVPLVTLTCMTPPSF